MDIAKIGRHAPSLIETEIDGDISLYHPPTEQVTVLNGTASDVWRLCDGERTIDDIADLLGRAYGVEPDSIVADITETIRQFQKAELLAE